MHVEKTAAIQEVQKRLKIIFLIAKEFSILFLNTLLNYLKNKENTF